jgi:O-antigen ligase
MGLGFTDNFITDIELLLGVGSLVCLFLYLVIRRPIAGLICFLFLVSTRANEYIPQSRVFRPSIGVGIIMLAGLLFFLLSNRQPVYFTGPQSFILVVFIAFCWSSLFAIEPVLHDRPAGFFIEPLLLVSVSFFATINTVRNMADFRKVLFILSFTGVVISLLTIVQSFFTGIMTGASYAYESEADLYTRAATAGLGPNGVAFTLVTILPFFFYLLDNEKGSILVKRLCILGIPLAVLTIFLTFSRGGFICLFVGFLLILRRRLNLKYFMGVVVLFLMIAILVPGAFWERVLGTATVDPTGQGRSLIWQGALRMIQAHPLTGVGYGQFVNELTRYQPYIGPTGPHNTFLGIAAETGLINLFIFVSLIFVTFYDLRQLKRSALIFSDISLAGLSEALKTSLVVAVIFGLTGDQRHSVIFYVCIALVVALKRIWIQPQQTMATDVPKLQEVA